MVALKVGDMCAAYKYFGWYATGINASTANGLAAFYHCDLRAFFSRFDRCCKCPRPGTDDGNVIRFFVVAGFTAIADVFL